MAKKKSQDNAPMLMAVILILVAVTGSVVVLAAQKYNSVQELQEQAVAEEEYGQLLLNSNKADTDATE